MPSWNDFSGIWSTLREIDINAIRDEAEQPLFIAVIGPPTATGSVVELLRKGAERFVAVGLDPLGEYGLALNASLMADLQQADLLILALDGRNLTRAVQQASEQLQQLGRPLLAVVLHAAPGGQSAARLAELRGIGLPNPAAAEAQSVLANAVLERLPSELQLAAARRLPGLRAALAQSLIGQTSFTNATYSLASGLPEQIPILSIPFAAADILVLTKNQGMLVYKLALALGAPPDFQARVKEVLPVLGGAYIWRQLARTLVGLIPIWGLVPKVAVSYAGTYVTGVAAWRWYAKGELVSGAQLQRLSNEALQLGRERALELIAQAQRQAGEAHSTTVMGASTLWQRVRELFPSTKKAAGPALSPPQEASQPGSSPPPSP